MRILAVRAPYRSDGPHPERAKPILPVKIEGDVQAYGVYDDGTYKFPIDEQTAEDIDTHRLTVVYEFHCGEVVAIRLVEDPQQGSITADLDESDEGRVYTDQDPGSSS